MSANKYDWHLKIIPEDDKWRQIANGFKRRLPQSLQRKVDICPIAGGWGKCLKLVKEFKLDQLEERHLLVLMDFDKRSKERQLAIDDSTRKHPRVFVLGATVESEDLIKSLGSGGAIACGERFYSPNMQCPPSIWQDAMLVNPVNQATLPNLCPVLQKHLT